MTHPAAAHPAVAPIGFFDRLAIVVLGLAGCALSYDALQQMAVAIHIRGLLTYLFPLVIDGFIAYGVRALLVLSHAPLRARLYVWVLFGTATAASIWANALHAVRLNQQTTHSGLRLGDSVVAILSTLAPLALAGAVHLYILITRHRPGTADAADHTQTVPGHRKAPQGRRMETQPRRQNEGQRTTADLTARTTDDEPAPAPDERTSLADGPAVATDRERGPVQDPGPEGADRVPSADRATDPDPDQSADHGTAAAVQRTGTGPRETASQRQTSKTAGQDALGARGPVEHARADRERDITGEPGPAHADQGAPADRMPDPEHPQTTDHTREFAPTDHGTPAPDQQTNPAPDPTDHAADQPADRPADHHEDGSSDGAQAARTTDHEVHRTARTKPADQDDEVPWAVKVDVARQAALHEGLMSRRAIRPHLRRNNISISNEGFRKLQDQLYADPELAHLPRNRRRS